MRILFITNLIPYPLDNGGKIKSFNTLKMLQDEKNVIDIFSFYETQAELESVEYVKTLFNEVYSIKKSLTTRTNMKKMMFIAFKSIFNKLPFVLLKYKDSYMSRLLQSKIKENKYDLIYIDHLQLGVYWNELKGANCPVYLDQHNCESQILKRKAALDNNFFKKMFINIEYKKLKKFEENMIRRCNKVIVLSDQDKKCLIDGSDIEDNKFITIPIPISTDYKKEIGKKLGDVLNILFLGTLSWFPNEQGVDWFVDMVIPYLEKSKIEYKLYIVGKDPSEHLVDKCMRNDNIVITGYVDDVNEYIDICDIMVAPIFIGSGMRVKILEGIGKNIPVISTTIGAEGIDIENNKNIVIANNEEEFMQGILKLMNSKFYTKIQINGEKLFHEKYSIEAITKQYRNSILGVVQEDIKK